MRNILAVIFSLIIFSHTSFAVNLEPIIDVKDVFLSPEKVQYISVRNLAKGIGAEIEWNKETKNTKITYNGSVLSLTVGSEDVYFDGYLFRAEKPVEVKDGRVVMPLVYLLEFFELEYLNPNIEGCRY